MRLRITILVCLFVSCAYALTPVKWNQRYQDYIDMYKDVAIYEMLKYNIPASITMAQGLLESGAGSSDLCRKGNNHFGIKCHDWTGATMHHDDDAQGECFRVYRSAFDSFEDHSLFLQRARYKQLFSLRRTDYAGWARGLKACGYATNPRYAQLLIDVITCYGLNNLDRETTYNAQNVMRLSQGSAMAVSGVNESSNDGGRGEHIVRMNNRNYYVVARKGDTFKSIAKEFNLSYRKLAKYNERNKNTVLNDGEIVYLEKKRSRAEKKYKKVPHIVKSGESMYYIAQVYGVRLKSLYKKNKLQIDDEIHVNDRIFVY